MNHPKLGHALDDRATLNFNLVARHFAPAQRCNATKQKVWYPLKARLYHEHVGPTSFDHLHALRNSSNGHSGDRFGGLAWRCRGAGGIARIPDRSLSVEHQRSDDRDDSTAPSQTLIGRTEQRLGLRGVRTRQSAWRVAASRTSGSDRARYIPPGHDRICDGAAVHGTQERDSFKGRRWLRQGLCRSDVRMQRMPPGLEPRCRRDSGAERHMHFGPGFQFGGALKSITRQPAEPLSLL